MIYLSKGGAGADSDHTWIRPCIRNSELVSVENLWPRVKDLLRLLFTFSLFSPWVLHSCVVWSLQITRGGGECLGVLIFDDLWLISFGEIRADFMLFLGVNNSFERVDCLFRELNNPKRP